MGLHEPDFTTISYQLSSDEKWSIHKSGCKDIARDAKDHWADRFCIDHIYGTLQEAIDSILDHEIIEMGYTVRDIKIHNCAKEADKMSKTKAKKPSASSNGEVTYFFECVDCGHKIDPTTWRTWGRYDKDSNARKRMQSIARGQAAVHARVHAQKAEVGS